MKVFGGNERYHGRYDLTDTRVVNNVKRKGKPATVKDQASKEDYTKHLEGEMGLGVIPILDDSTVLWAALDIDKYDLDINRVLNLIKDTPFLPCRTKSNGLHLYVFFKQNEEAKSVIPVLRDLSKKLGFPTCEIFPKQEELNVERNDIGSWINLPYYDSKESDRFAYDVHNGSHLSLEQFLQEIELKRTTLKLLKKTGVAGPKLDDLSILDGPPCLEHLTQVGFPKGSRNHALFNLGVYYKKSNPDNYEDLVEKANQKYMNPGIAEEVSALKKALKNKDYKYKCKEQPICDHCDRGICLGRKFGIGEGDAIKFPQINRVLKILTDPPKYFVEVNGQKLGPVDSEVFLNQTKFKKLCFEGLNLVVPFIKGLDWDKLMATVMLNIEEVEVGEENSQFGRLMELFEEFSLSHRLTTNKEEILVGRIYNDGERLHFRMGDFITFLNANDFKDLKPNAISAKFKDMKFDHGQLKVHGQCVRVWISSISTVVGAELKVKKSEEIL